MKKIFKAASVVSLALTPIAAFSLTGVSFALEASEDNVPEQDIVVDPALIEAEAETKVVFEAPEEVAAVIPQSVIEADEAANRKSEADALAAAQNDTSDDFNNSGAGSLRQLVRQQTTNGSLNAEMECLAGTVYFESKGESLKGQLAVARVVMARAESSRFPNSICGVVYQRKQFSFIRGGKMPRINRGGQHWRNAVAIAKIAKNDAWKSPVEGALFFHARYVSPGWRLKRLATIDNHIFYR